MIKQPAAGIVSRVTAIPADHPSRQQGGEHQCDGDGHQHEAGDQGDGMLLQGLPPAFANQRVAKRLS
jgi:hypothetical protein